jgi:hypothetical protein
VLSVSLSGGEDLGAHVPTGSVHSSFCPASTAPTRRMMASRPGKMPTTSVRLLISYSAAPGSLNYQLRKVTKARGHFPSDAAAVKLLWLAIINIEDKRACDRANRKKNKHGNWNGAPARLIEGQRTTGWCEAPQELDIAYPGRLGNRKLTQLKINLQTWVYSLQPHQRLAVAGG